MLIGEEVPTISSGQFWVFCYELKAVTFVFENITGGALSVIFSAVTNYGAGTLQIATVNVPAGAVVTYLLTRDSDPHGLGNFSLPNIINVICPTNMGFVAAYLEID